jgi:RloB-like protein
MNMILTNRRFVRESPTREAKSIYIFCEGIKREYEYFEYFREMDSRINVEIYKLDHTEDNSPLGLLNIAINCIVLSDENPNPKYSFQEKDEVWLVFDTDIDKNNSRTAQIDRLRLECSKKSNWYAVQSNPCFEVWLYYHQFENKPTFEGYSLCSNWKIFVNDSYNGGFDSRKHPIYIEDASKNAKNNFSTENEIPTISSTEVFRLANSIFPLLKSKITKILKEI